MTESRLNHPTPGTCCSLAGVNRLTGSASAVRDARKNAKFGENSLLKGWRVPEGGGDGPEQWWERGTGGGSMVATTGCFLCKAAWVVGSRQWDCLPTALKLTAPNQGEVQDLSDLCAQTNQHHCNCTSFRRPWQRKSERKRWLNLLQRCWYWQDKWCPNTPWLQVCSVLKENTHIVSKNTQYCTKY